MEGKVLTEEYFERRLEVLEQRLEQRLEQKLEQKLEEKLDKKLDEKFEEFALMIAKEFANVYRKFDEQSAELKEYMHEHFATKMDLYDTETRMNARFDRLEDRVGKIEGHIGRMEIRFSHLDDIVINDHSPRIKNLEVAAGI